MTAPWTDLERQVGTDLCAAVLAGLTGLKPQTTRKYLKEEICGDKWCGLARSLMHESLNAIGSDINDALKVSR